VGAAGGAALGAGVSPQTGTILLARAGLLRGGAAATGAGAVATKQAIANGDGFLAVVNRGGDVIARAHLSLGHERMIEQQLGGVLPSGAQAVTVMKSAGEIVVRNSSKIHQNMQNAPGWVQDAIKSQFQ
jgi:hypothetical protein